jgi:hypothetical protein
MPVGNTTLAQAVLYLATAPNSYATDLAYGAAADEGTRLSRLSGLGPAIESARS